MSNTMRDAFMRTNPPSVQQLTQQATEFHEKQISKAAAEAINNVHGNIKPWRKPDHWSGWKTNEAGQFMYRKEMIIIWLCHILPTKTQPAFITFEFQGKYYELLSLTYAVATAKNLVTGNEEKLYTTNPVNQIEIAPITSVAVQLPMF